MEFKKTKPVQLYSTGLLQKLKFISGFGDVRYARVLVHPLSPVLDSIIFQATAPPLPSIYVMLYHHLPVYSNCGSKLLLHFQFSFLSCDN